MKSTVRTRVLMLLENNPYPQDRRVLPEALALTGAGYQVTVIAPARPGQPMHEILDAVHVYRFPAPPPANSILGYLWEYAYSMVMTFVISLFVSVRQGFDIVHTHNPPDTFVFIGAFYKLFGTRFVFDHHDLSPEMYCARFRADNSGLLYHALVWFEKLSCRLADHVIATNESYMAIQIRRGGVPKERITIVRNGPDLDRLRPVDSDPGLGQKGKTIVGYVGVMGDQDGIDYLLRALRHLACDLGRTDFLCVLIGHGDAWARLKELAANLGLEDHVWFTGHVSEADLIRYLSAADICVDPDPSNEFNDRSTMIKVMEYMALGKPIVAFDLPEHRVTAQQAACYVRPNDELEFARALAQLMDDPDRRQAMGRFGRRRAEEVLAWSHSVPSLLKVYEAVLGDETRPPGLPGSGLSPGFKSKCGRWTRWLGERSPSYIALRLLSLSKRYGLTPAKAERRILDCVRDLARHGCFPTFPTPGRLVQKYPEFSRTVAGMGAELALHGYDHVDFRNLSRFEATQQFALATAAFQRSGIQADGFRCPYLSSTDQVVQAIPNGLVQYTSNRAIWWESHLVPPKRELPVIFESLWRFYRPESSSVVVATPRASGGLIEIPVSLPDDLQLCDGLRLGKAGVRLVWSDIFRQIHSRGELFVLLFHPESYEECRPAFESVLNQAKRQQPGVWVTQLRDINRWWREKAAFRVSTERTASGLHVHFDCSDRATVLVRNLQVKEALPWQGSYQVLKGESRTLHLRGDRQPFVGLPPTAPSWVVSFLTEQGYILDQTQAGSRCGVYLGADCLGQLTTEVQLIDYIESSAGPLVRFWRWPNEAKSALCLTGDMDALSIMDYAARLFTI